jgi:hypothetical protein
MYSWWSTLETEKMGRIFAVGASTSFAPFFAYGKKGRFAPFAALTPVKMYDGSEKGSELWHHETMVREPPQGGLPHRATRCLTSERSEA